MCLALFDELEAGVKGIASILECDAEGLLK